MHYADAFYYDNEGVKYYYFDIYNEKDTATGEMTYPEITFTVAAKKKTAINGTYDIIRGDFWRSSGDMVDIDATQPATVTIQNIDLVKVIEDRNLLLVKGAIPGGKGSLVKVREAIKGQGK